MKEKLRGVLRLYCLANKLKDKVRSGWDGRHWNIRGKRRESVAEHTFGACMLAIGLDSEFDLDLDINKVILMLLIHDWGEATGDDITPFDGVASDVKHFREVAVVNHLTEGMRKRDYYRDLWNEFEARETKEAIMAYYCDKYDADAQSKVYQDRGCHNPLDKQKKNRSFRSEKIQQIIRDGAKTAFDVWYAYDKPLYANAEKFAELLELLREVDTQQF